MKEATWHWAQIVAAKNSTISGGMGREVMNYHKQWGIGEPGP